ncbi:MULTISPECIES: PRTRC system protein B [Xanthomonas]|uniref:PRTRC system protein B n=6 Tax=Xanthomonas TaxID=338 RepID=A0AAJ2X027_XANCA|nr:MULTISPECIES: PRTRC system protein B [Xanthomonas]MBD5078015.1 PRTRC system protein B [Xanthomonas citri pv. citri]MEB1846230.1 PRTRC system protein B [Xanthomonas campestris pv. campestris]APP78165.1 hypothetical protein BJD12_22805 [Xanthomonas vesicatoria ATCC 35937]APP87350.1 hypothetical protein BI317_25155 [Xanthomonas hortorum pv. gardneri]EGD10841.1 hypothetical protein XVE_0896 [Xanthomonas vesicatoria ATCC 35937]
MSHLIDTPDAESLKNYMKQNSVAPTHAILFYQRRGRLVLTTAHTVDSHRGTPRIGPGRPMTPEQEASIVALLMGREADDGSSRVRVMPQNVLHTDGASTTWLQPSVVEPMVLRTGSDVRTVLARWPTLVFHARNRQLYVVALRDDQWPSDDSLVFHCPTGNVWAKTMVCTGTAVLPMGCTPSEIPAWKASFFESAFTHSNHGKTITVPKPKGTGKSKGHQANPDPMTYWAERDGVMDAFPSEHLTPLKMTLSEWMSSLIHGESVDD